MADRLHEASNDRDIVIRNSEDGRVDASHPGQQQYDDDDDVADLGRPPVVPPQFLDPPPPLPPHDAPAAAGGFHPPHRPHLVVPQQNQVTDGGQIVMGTNDNVTSGSSSSNHQALLRQQAFSQAALPQQPYHPTHHAVAGGPPAFAPNNNANNLLSMHHQYVNMRGVDSAVPYPPRYNMNVEMEALIIVPAAERRGGGAQQQEPQHFNAMDLFPEEHYSSEEMMMQRAPSAGWSEVDPAGGGIPPSARSLHSAALLNGVLYVFGGYDGSQRVNSFHAYCFAEKRWSPVLPSANSRAPPSPRDRHVSVAYGKSFYVHGGFDGTSRDDSLFAFDFSTMEWRQVLAIQGRPPSARHSHAAVIYEHSMYIFGGYDGSYKSDLHEFDFLTSRWSAVPAAGRRPRARYRGTCTVYKNWMILYGGHDGTRHLSDTFLFDFETKTWSALISEGSPPIPRDSHVSVVHGNSMYVFGGSSGSAMNDLHELQLPANGDFSIAARWRPVSTARADQPRHRFCHVAVAYNDSMYAFGGYDGADRLHSFIKFDFAVHDLSFEIPPATIISDCRSMVNNETFSDVTFIVEDRSVYAHKLMLMRCSYFEALFLGQMREARMNLVRIEQVRYDIFLSILEYLYTDQLAIGFGNAMELFEAADLFGIHRLKTMCEKRMLEQITVENAAMIFHAADMHSATALRQKTKSYILSHFAEVSKSTSFEEMGRSNIELVFELLKGR